MQQDLATELSPARLALALTLFALTSACASTGHGAGTNGTHSAKASKPPGSTMPAVQPLPLERAGDDGLTALKTYRVTRWVSMYYRLDLHKDNRYSPAMARALRAHEGQFRSCYTARLNAMPTLKGDIELSFELPTRSRQMSQIIRAGGTLSDRAMQDCLINELAKMQFTAPSDLHGKLHYSFGAVESLARND